MRFRRPPLAARRTRRGDAPRLPPRPRRAPQDPRARPARGSSARACARRRPSRFRRWLRVVVATVAVAMGFVALARPQKGMHWETLERNGIDLLLVVDTSKSMDADDVKPTRLERAKLAIRDLVDRFPGDRIGLVAFAGDAFVQSPMTLDHGALLESVDALDTSVIARGGTNIGRGIDVAAEALATEPGRQKVMVLSPTARTSKGRGSPRRSRPRRRGSPSTPSASVRSPASSFRRGTREAQRWASCVTRGGARPVAPRRSRAPGDRRGGARHLSAARAGWARPRPPLRRVARRLDARRGLVADAPGVLGVVRDPARAGAPGHRARRAARAQVARSGSSSRSVLAASAPAMAAAAAGLLLLASPDVRARVGGERGEGVCRGSLRRRREGVR